MTNGALNPPPTARERSRPTGLLTLASKGCAHRQALLNAWLAGELNALRVAVSAANAWCDALWKTLTSRALGEGRVADGTARVLQRHALDLARTLAISTWLVGWLAYTDAPRRDARPRAPREAITPDTLQALVSRPFRRVVQRARPSADSQGRHALLRVVAAHQRDLSRSKTAAADRDPAALLRVARAAWRRLSAELTSASQHVADESARVRFAWWLRRRAAFFGAQVLLVERALEPRSASGLAQAAKRRSALVRSIWTFEHAVRGVRAPGLAARGLIGTIERLTYDAPEETPGQPLKQRGHGILRGGLRVEVPYKHLAAHGATEGAAIWLRGKATDDGLEVEQEGVREAAKTVWEDYLADLVRPAFDLAPGAILAEWELPERTAKRRTTDLLARIRGSVRRKRGEA